MQYSSILNTMLAISTSMSQSQDLRASLNTMSAGLQTLIPFTSMAVFEARDDGVELEQLFFQSIAEQCACVTTIPVGHGLIGKIAHSREPLQSIADSVPEREYPFSGAVKNRSHRTLLAHPMEVDGELMGVMVMERPGTILLGADKLFLLRMFSVQAAAALRNARLLRQNHDLYLGGIRALTSAVDAKDPFNHGHSERVGRLARLIGDELGLGPAEQDRVEVAALLHDIGKIGIPDAILQKPGPLDQRERAVMMGHADLGARILHNTRSTSLMKLASLVRHHHEWWNGCGYPAGLAGEDIPLGARIISVADALDTITTDRPYCKGRTQESARGILRDAAGIQFDPEIVNAFHRASSSGRLTDYTEDVPASVLEADLQRPADPAVVVPLSGTTQPGDLRWLGLLVDLAHITSLMTSLSSLLERLTALLAEHLALGHVGFHVFGITPNTSISGVRGIDGRFAFEELTNTPWIESILAQDLPAALRDPGSAGIGSEPSTLFHSNAAAAALICDDTPVGVLIFRPRNAQRTWKSDAGAIESISPHLAAAINLARVHETAVKQAVTDSLTGVFNHRGFYQLLARSIDQREPFCLIMFDVVGLKRINDTWGHVAGDRLLHLVSDCITSVTGAHDRVARYGGDEFAVILDGVSCANHIDAMVGDITLRLNIRARAVFEQDIAVRYGWSHFPRDGTERDTLVNVADRRMYSRHSGR